MAIKHIVLFKFRAADSSASKLAQLIEIKKALEALNEKIDCVQEIKAGINTNPTEDYELALEVLVDNLVDLDAYARHPLHLRVLEELIKPQLAARACVDIELRK